MLENVPESQKKLKKIKLQKIPESSRKLQKAPESSRNF
jgi:hypothetical protein